MMTMMMMVSMMIIIMKHGEVEDDEGDDGGDNDFNYINIYDNIVITATINSVLHEETVSKSNK